LGESAQFAVPLRTLRSKASGAYLSSRSGNLQFGLQHSVHIRNMHGLPILAWLCLAVAVHQERPSELLRKVQLVGLGGEVAEVGHTGSVENQRHKSYETVIGPDGPKGDTGDTGAVGPKGATGKKGEAGDRGPQGETGDVGEEGEAPEIPTVPPGVAKTTMIGVAFALHLAIMGAVFAAISGKINGKPKTQKPMGEGEAEEHTEGEEYAEGMPEEAMPEEGFPEEEQLS